MKIYRNSYIGNGNQHDGYSFHTSKEKAEATANRYRKKRWQTDDDESPFCEAETECLELPANRLKDFIAFLSKYASHPDNG